MQYFIQFSIVFWMYMVMHNQMHKLREMMKPNVMKIHNTYPTIIIRFAYKFH